MKAAADVITRGGAIIVFPLIARNAGAGGYGAYCQVTTITGFIVPFATLGLTAVLVRFFSADMLTPALKKRFLHIIAIVFAATALSGVLMASAAAPINRIFLKSDIGIALFRWGAPRGFGFPDLPRHGIGIAHERGHAFKHLHGRAARPTRESRAHAGFIQRSPARRATEYVHFSTHGRAPLLVRNQPRSARFLNSTRISALTPGHSAPAR